MPKSFRERADEFHKLNDTGRWKYVLEHKDEIEIFLDNDLTYGHFIADEANEDNDYERVMLDFDWYVGWSDGIQFLLRAAGIKAQSV